MVKNSFVHTSTTSLVYSEQHALPDIYDQINELVDDRKSQSNKKQSKNQEHLTKT
jgi:hypothetical protein